LPAFNDTMSDGSPKARAHPAETGQAGPREKAAATRDLSPAAQRALTEAAERRAAAGRQSPDAPKEIQGREGPDPTRYGDWENKGIASDF